MTDCTDFFCEGTADRIDENSDEACHDGLDIDDDGFVDQDPSCAAFTDC